MTKFYCDGCGAPLINECVWLSIGQPVKVRPDPWDASTRQYADDGPGANHAQVCTVCGEKIREAVTRELVKLLVAP